MAGDEMSADTDRGMWFPIWEIRGCLVLLALLAVMRGWELLSVDGGSCGDCGSASSEMRPALPGGASSAARAYSGPVCPGQPHRFPDVASYSGEDADLGRFHGMPAAGGGRRGFVPATAGVGATHAAGDLGRGAVVHKVGDPVPAGGSSGRRGDVRPLGGTGGAGRFPLAPLLSGDHQYGREDARINLILFADFTCPHCRSLFRPLLELADREPRRFSITFRSFPLESGGLEGLRLAVLGECAARLGGNRGFWHASEVLFHTGDPDRVAAAAGISAGELDECSGDPAVVERIRESARQGEQLMLSAVPAVVLRDAETGIRLILQEPGNVTGILEAADMLEESLQGTVPPDGGEESGGKGSGSPSGGKADPEDGAGGKLDPVGVTGSGAIP